MASLVNAGSKPDLHRACAAIACTLFLAAGLWVSLHYSLGVWKADPDVFVTVELWRGVQRYGLAFIPSWAHTVDNWLLSLIPISSLLYQGFGATARMAVLIGWLFFLASVGLTAWITAKVTNKRVAAVVGGVLLFANVQTTGPVGYLSYPISHNISMAWGLLALALALAALERRSYLLCIASGLAVLVDAVSDPWASGAIAIPLIIVSGALAVAARRNHLGGCALALSLTSAVALWIASQHPFGIFGFLLKANFQIGGRSSALHNLQWGYRALGAMFNIVPGAGIKAAAAIAVSFIALAAILTSAVLFVLVRLGHADVRRQLVAGVAILSLCAIAVLYLTGAPYDDLHVGRFFPNVYFLGPILVAIAASEAAKKWPGAIKSVALTYGALFVIAGALSAPHLWAGKIPPSEPDGAMEFGRFLQANALSYGYGPFWGSKALPMETLTEGAVTIRPVSFLTGRISRRRQETSGFWYRPAAEPAGRPIFLFIMDDSEECPSVSACEKIARRQFGDPVERLSYGTGIVLVWRRPLAHLIDPMPQ